MTDDPLAELRADWNRQPVDPAFDVGNLPRWRRRTYWLIAADVSAATTTLVAGICFAVIAWKTRDWLFGLSAATLLFAGPPPAISVIRTRRSSLIWNDETPEGMLRFALRRALAVHRILAVQFWNGIVLLCFVAAIWLCVGAGLISRQYPLLLMSAIWIAAALAALLWARWRMARNAIERQRCERLLAKFHEAKTLESHVQDL